MKEGYRFVDCDTHIMEPRYNNMLKNFSAIVGYPVTVA